MRGYTRAGCAVAVLALVSWCPGVLVFRVRVAARGCDKGYATEVAAGAVTRGSSAGQHTLILRWNGTGWTRVPGPNPGGRGLVDSLRGVAATSPASAWP